MDIANKYKAIKYQCYWNSVNFWRKKLLNEGV